MEADPSRCSGSLCREQPSDAARARPVVARTIESDGARSHPAAFLNAFTVAPCAPYSSAFRRVSSNFERR